MNNKLYIQIKKIKENSYILAGSNITKRNKLLQNLARNIKHNQANIIKANHKDLKNFLPNNPLYDRLLLNKERILEIIGSIEAVIKLSDPIGKVLYKRRLGNGLMISRVNVPLGLICVIYESRPNVTVEISSLCIKAGNAVILKGGRDAYYTNMFLGSLIKKSLKQAGLPDVVYLADPFKKKLVNDLLKMDNLLDVIIPRGGRGLIEFVRKNSTVPVIETGAGVCHTYVGKSANFKKALEIIYNAKTQRPSVCNALDTVVIDKSISGKFLPQLARRFLDSKVIIKADRESYKLLKKYYPNKFLHKAKANNFGREFLSLTMSIKTVRDFKEAFNFIQKHTSGHSEAVITENKKIAELFLSTIDAASVYSNASTRFTDGFQFGLGAEVGISTQKLHVRGPMGLEALTSYKWIIRGRGQIRP